MSQVSGKITIVVKTFERPDLIKRCVASVRALHPDMPIVVADDSQEPVSFEGDSFTRVLALPYDSGISFGRNRALEKVETPYYLLIDDDHCFEKDSNLDALVALMDHSDLDIVALRMIDYRAGKAYSRGELIFAGTTDIDDGVFTHRVGETRGKCAGLPLYDLVLNCYLAKKASTHPLSFDERIKIGKEHGDYFLQAKALGLKISVAETSYIHHRPVYSKRYKTFRKRSDEFTKIFFEKYGISSEQTLGAHYFIPNKFVHYLKRLVSLFRLPGAGR